MWRPSVREDKLLVKWITTGGPQTARERPYTEEEPEDCGVWSRLFGR
jgi:hypothetical protein